MNIKLTLLLLILIHINSYSQSSKSDFLVTKEDDTIFCKVVGLKGKRIEFIKRGEGKSRKKNIFNFSDLSISNLSVINNPLNLKIVKPEEGYAHIYLYRPYVYTGSALACKVEYNGESFVNIKTYSYYLHKVKAGEVHTYNWNNDKKNIITIKPSTGETYFIRGSFKASFEQWEPWRTNTGWSSQSTFSSGSISNNTTGFNSGFMVTNGMNIFIDNPNTAKYAILTMKKESPKY
ncbi:DUF2846 domain-containing protein [uncultured Algibacter sp.]|uniref:DUF2846 domain-containing protein n=1 Tax=uncultured Algibacter sp. TaxID=298659 RepID=UPI00260BF5D8|nr:DUF2846 domain-containing protein [uncultured Algibacter sp.]